MKLCFTFKKLKKKLKKREEMDKRLCINIKGRVAKEPNMQKT